jgi:hypothetical protein
MTKIQKSPYSLGNHPGYPGWECKRCQPGIQKVSCPMGGRGGIGEAWQVRSYYLFISRAVWQGVSTDSLMCHPGPPGLTLLRPVGGSPSKRPYGQFWGGTPAEQAACGRLLPPWIPHAVRSCSSAAWSWKSPENEGFFGTCKAPIPETRKLQTNSSPFVVVTVHFLLFSSYLQVSTRVLNCMFFCTS